MNLIITEIKKLAMNIRLIKSSLFFSAFFLSIFLFACRTNLKKKPIADGRNMVVTDSLRYKSLVFDSVEVKKDIFFTEVTNENDSLIKLCLDVYTPFGDIIQSRPVILWVHGGGFTFGNDKTQSYIKTLANTFSKRGYVSVSTDYRVRKNPHKDISGTINDAVNDVMKALEWIRENSEKYGIDKSSIIIGGGSAGGILATNLCYKDANDSTEWDKSGLIAFVNLWGSPGKNMMYQTIDKNDPPTIFIHGMADSIVSFSNTLRLSGDLESVGVKYKVFGIEGAGHTPIDHLDDIVKNIESFLYDKIKANTKQE